MNFTEGLFLVFGRASFCHPLSPVEFEGEKDELEDVDGAEELQFKGAVVPHAPYAHRHRHHADENLRREEIML